MDKKTQNLIKKIEALGYTAVDVDNYQDPSSLIKVACKNGHQVTTS